MSIVGSNSISPANSNASSDVSSLVIANAIPNLISDGGPNSRSGKDVTNVRNSTPQPPYQRHPRGSCYRSCLLGVVVCSCVSRRVVWIFWRCSGIDSCFGRLQEDGRSCQRKFLPSPEQPRRFRVECSFLVDVLLQSHLDLRKHLPQLGYPGFLHIQSYREGFITCRFATTTITSTTTITTTTTTTTTTTSVAILAQVSFCCRRMSQQAACKPHSWSSPTET